MRRGWEKAEGVEAMIFVCMEPPDDIDFLWVKLYRLQIFFDGSFLFSVCTETLIQDTALTITAFFMLCLTFQYFNSNFDFVVCILSSNAVRWIIENGDTNISGDGLTFFLLLFWANR
jgi:hypothetical protein